MNINCVRCVMHRGEGAAFVVYSETGRMLCFNQSGARQATAQLKAGKLEACGFN